MTFPDVKSLPDVQGERIVKLALHLNIIAWHGHFAIGFRCSVGPVEDTAFI